MHQETNSSESLISFKIIVFSEFLNVYFRHSQLWAHYEIFSCCLKYLHNVRQQDGEASVNQALDHVKARLKHELEERTTANDDLGPLLSRFSIDELGSSFTEDTFT